MSALRWGRSAIATSKFLRWGRSELGGTAPSTPKVRWGRAAVTGAAVSAPRVRWGRAGLAGSAAVTLAPIPAQTVEPGTLVELTAVLTSGSPGAFAWRIVSVSPAGTPVGLVVDGEDCRFTAPSAVDGTRAPVQVTVVVGATVTVDGITSPEQTATITVLPQLSWVYDGTKFVGSKRQYVTV